MSEPMHANGVVIPMATAKALSRAMAQVEKNTAPANEWDWEALLVRDKKKNFDAASGLNVTTVLTHHPVWKDAFRFDSFGGKIVIEQDCPAGKAGEDWTDVRDKLTSDWLEGSKYRLRPSKATVLDSVNLVAHEREFHPIRTYLQSLEWDGVPRVDLFAARYLGARSHLGTRPRSVKAHYLAKVSAILLLGPVARVMRPGCMLKTVAILEGPQDLGKSRAIRALCPRESWFSDSEIQYGSKDAYQGLRGKWLIELAEIDKELRGRHSASTIKAFISSPSDYYRDSYGRRFADNPRQGAFIGSTNQTEYLTDETGGCRWLPFMCGRPDVAAIGRDRDQLWAEAYARFSNGERWWLEDGAVLAFARTEQADRYAADVWTERIKELVSGSFVVHTNEFLPVRNEKTPEAITTPWLLEHLGIETKHQGTSEQMRVSKIMTALGYSHRRRRVAGERSRVWERLSRP
jgi:putative DNA primase/helicase